MSPKRLEHFHLEALGLKLFFGTERVSDEVIEALYELAEEAQVYDKMQALQAGEIVNFIEGVSCEQRAALHTAMRDIFSSPREEKNAKEAAFLAQKEIEKLKKTASLLDSFTDLVQIGIGGSSLGPEAIYLGLEAYCQKGKKVHFVSNVDPDEIAHLFRQLDLRKTVVVVVSKSGSTLETLTNESFAREKFKRAGLDPRHHFIAVTAEKSPLDHLVVPDVR